MLLKLGSSGTQCVAMVTKLLISYCAAPLVEPYCKKSNISVTNWLRYIVYVIESAAYGVLFTSCLCQKPERARYERVRAFDTNNE